MYALVIPMARRHSSDHKISCLFRSFTLQVFRVHSIYAAGEADSVQGHFTS